MRRRRLRAPLLALAVLAAVPGAAAQTPAPPPGPDAQRCADARLRCPDLRMARPYQVSDGFTPRRRNLLFSATAILSRGRGPIVLEGRRRDRRSMFTRQRIYRTSGSHVTFGRPGARIVFKPIPGQGAYWKLQDAAKMELWSTGPQRRLVRTSPKLVYCFRDLRRTHPSARSPRTRVFGACSRDRGRSSVLLGTSVGWADIYPAAYHEQYVDVTGLRGCFALWHIADPGDHIVESNEANNAARTYVRLPWKPGRTGNC